jgi:hypothetical protein
MPTNKEQLLFVLGEIKNYQRKFHRRYTLSRSLLNKIKKAHNKVSYICKYNDIPEIEFSRALRDLITILQQLDRIVVSYSLPVISFYGILNIGYDYPEEVMVKLKEYENTLID